MSEDQVSRDRFCVMERKLLKGIMTPSMLVVWALGITLVWMNPSIFQTGAVTRKTDSGADPIGLSRDMPKCQSLCRRRKSQITRVLSVV